MQKLVFLNPKNSSPQNQSMLIRNIFTSLTRTNPQISTILNHFSLNHSTPLQKHFKLSRKNQIFCSSFPYMASDCKTIHSKRPQGVPLPPITADKADLFRGLEAALGSPLSSEPLSPSPKPLIIVISGPSGVGKDAVIKKLREVREGIHFVVTATSRGKRPGEIDGKDYYFVTKEQFLLMVERNELLEYALVYGDYKGIPKQQIRDFMSKGNDIVLRVDIQGAATLKSILGDSAVFIFLVAESENALVKRLVDRKTETTENLLLRIATAREEVKHIKNFDYVVVNAEGMLENAVKLVESIIDAEKAKVRQRTVNI